MLGPNKIFPKQKTPQTIQIAFRFQKKNLDESLDF